MTSFDTLGHQYRFNHVLLNLALREFAGEDWLHCPAPGGNPAHWILGHVVYYRRRVLEILDRTANSAVMQEAFGRASTPQAPFNPSTEELLGEFKTSGQEIAKALLELTDAAAAADLGHELPDGSTTVGAALHFLYTHETLHIGQLQYLGRCLGKAGIP